jgi:hypothetical protein
MCVGGRRAYDEAVKEALIVMWEASDRICGKCLKAIIPELLDAMERHDYLDLDPEVKRRVLRVSTATIDRLLKPIRSGAKSRRKWRRPKKVSKEVPVRTFADWDQPDPGYLEMDFVVHSGVSMAGSFIHTLVTTDVCSGRTELPTLEQSLPVDAFPQIIHVDNCSQILIVLSSQATLRPCTVFHGAEHLTLVVQMIRWP